MKNLQDFGVQELSAKEKKEIDGGGFFTFLAVCLVIGIVAGLWNSEDSCPE